MKLLAIFLSLIALFAAELVEAKSNANTGPAPFKIKAEIIRMNGTGCPQGSVAAAISPDQSTLSVLFDKLGTQIAAGSGVLQDTKKCLMILGVKFTGQYRVAIIGSDVRGFASVPANAVSKISVTHRSIYAQNKEMDFHKIVQGPSEQNIEMANRFPKKPLWSDCGSQMAHNPMTMPFMFIELSVTSQNNNAAEDLVAMIDSFDFSAAPLSYQIAWRRDTQTCPK